MEVGTALVDGSLQNIVIFIGTFSLFDMYVYSVLFECRCVGHYDANTHNSMKCVSVRLASDAEKRNRETLIATSCRALQEWMHSTSET